MEDQIHWACKENNYLPLLAPHLKSITKNDRRVALLDDTANYFINF